MYQKVDTNLNFVQREKKTKKILGRGAYLRKEHERAGRLSHVHFL